MTKVEDTPLTLFYRGVAVCTEGRGSVLRRLRDPLVTRLACRLTLGQPPSDSQMHTKPSYSKGESNEPAIDYQSNWRHTPAAAR